jgi:hypothetical protein
MALGGDRINRARMLCSEGAKHLRMQTSAQPSDGLESCFSEKLSAIWSACSVCGDSLSHNNDVFGIPTFLRLEKYGL